jgi:hypothetical protein
MREVRFEREGTAVLEDDMLEGTLKYTRVEVQVLYVVHSAVVRVGGLQE